MRIGLIDVDGHNYPNLALMKLSAYHKAQGDSVEWYQPMFSGHMDKVYMSKVFSFTPDYEYCIDADEIVKGGSGYCIELNGNRECYNKEKDVQLSYEIEHIMPDYSIYGITNTAYGYMSRGCPRQCDFCHVKDKEGIVSYKVADLSEFWNGQRYIEILDPNTLACKDWKSILTQCAESGARINFNQGMDIRMMTEEKAEMLNDIKLQKLHFAWDRIEDKEFIQDKFKTFRKISKTRQADSVVYVLVGNHKQEILDADMERIYWLRENGYAPYVMIYNKENLPKGNELRKLQRWVNNRFIFWSTPTFEEYLKGKG